MIVQIAVPMMACVGVARTMPVLRMNGVSAMERTANAIKQMAAPSYSDGAEESMLYFFMSLRKYFRSISASRAAWLMLYP